MAPIKISSPPTHEFWEIEVLYEDEHLLALNKPAGLLLSPDHKNSALPSLMGLIHAGIKEGKPWATERHLGYLMNAHRLDLETSGALLLAKSKPVLQALANLFGSEKPVRHYLALAQGMPVAEKFEMDGSIAPHPVKPGLMHVDAKRGKRARTLFQVLERFHGWTLMRCSPLTERKHQVRVHLRQARLPLAGDADYGGSRLMLSRVKPNFRLKPQKTERPLLDRPTLHAESLELPHPVTGAALQITAPWPKELTVAVKYLRKYATAPAHQDTSQDTSQASTAF
jgi:RluA family pseudouridine synthase